MCECKQISHSNAMLWSGSRMRRKREWKIRNPKAFVPFNKFNEIRGKMSITVPKRKRKTAAANFSLLLPLLMLSLERGVAFVRNVFDYDVCMLSSIGLCNISARNYVSTASIDIMGISKGNFRNLEFILCCLDHTDIFHICLQCKNVDPSMSALKDFDDVAIADFNESFNE